MGKKNKRQRAQNRIAEGANAKNKKMRTAGSTKSKKKARVAEKIMQQELNKRRKQEEMRKLQEQVKKSTVRKKQARVPYSSSDWILLIGEGNFSFARALGRLFQNEPHRTGRILATSYDSAKELLEKYPESPEILEELTRLGVIVLHGIDATALHSCAPLHRTIRKLLHQQQLLDANAVTVASTTTTMVTTTSITTTTTVTTSSIPLSSSSTPSTTRTQDLIENEEEEEEEEEGGEEEGDEEEEEEEKSGLPFDENQEEEEGEGEEEGDEGDNEREEAEEEDEEEEEEESGIDKNASVAVFNKIVFNFPHTGCGVKDTTANNRIHQKFMLKFFASSLQLLRPPSPIATPTVVESEEPEKFRGVSGKDRHRWERDNQMKEKKAKQLQQKQAKKTHPSDGLRLSEVHVTLKQGEPYSSWQIPRIARHSGLRAKSGLDFFPELYPGYEHRRTRGVARENPNEFILKAGQGQSAGAAKTYVFVPIMKAAES